MAKEGKTKKWHLLRHSLYASIALFFIIATLKLAVSELLPHNVEGYIYHSDKTTGAGGLPVFINNTATGDSVLVYSQDVPPFPPFLGKYSATINGNDGDLVVVTSWNKSHYGTNSANLLSTTTTINVILNMTRPSEANVTIVLPANNSLRNTTDPFYLTANITMLGNDGVDCNATIMFGNTGAINITADQNFTNMLGNMELGSSKLTTWNLTGVKEGLSDVTVAAQCLSDGRNFDNVNENTISITIEDTTPPYISLISPLNKSWLKNNITFKYNVTENTGIKNCSLFFDGKPNQTTYNPDVGVSLNFTLNNTPEGAHQWFVSCFDNSSNLNNGNSTLRVVNIDHTKPNITLLFPFNNTLLTQHKIVFRYNVTDNFNIANCSLILGNDIVQTNYTIALNDTNNFTKSLAGGDYNWSVNCSDKANNIGESSETFTIISSDLKVNSSDLAFSKENPVEGELIEINGTVFNLGVGNATNITVQFFENDPAIGGLQIEGNKTVNVSGMSNVTVSINYTTKVGKVDIFIIVDPPLATNGSVIESNESNNKANRSISIPPYHIFYGNVISDVFLDLSSEKTIIAWINATSIRGNIFVADSDSTIDFKSLKALSRDLTNNLVMDDFEELDIALGIVNLSDSINRTYTSNGAIKNTGSFTIFNSIITDVPITNSTNNSDFVTGILWDTSDVNEGQFNGSQDVVFITKINKSSLGLYGNYDYEIKIPANLRMYIRPNVQDTVSFYREIT
jgi:hypothetical protein